MKFSELEGDPSIGYSVPGREKPAKEGIKSVEISEPDFVDVKLEKASSEYSHSDPAGKTVLEGLSCLVIDILS